MCKLLVICGPTAVGKTKFAVSLAEKFNGEIVSADSRQVYRGMDIATGKDLQVYGNVPVHMLDVVDLKEPYSVAQYSDAANKAIKNIQSRGKLPILVGGTGLYIKAVIDGIQTLNIPPNTQLRKEYENKTASELFDILSEISSDVAASLNASEEKNKRRLIRKIEIAQSNELSTIYRYIGNTNVLLVGLTAPPNVLRQRINDRISNWVENGVENEIKKLLASGISWDNQSMTAIGYREWKSYFDGGASVSETIEEWKRDEWQYAKRQITWFKRDARINWFDIENSDWHQTVAKIVREWYN